MGRNRVSGTSRSNRHRRYRAPPGLKIIERDGYWHIVGTLRVKGRSLRCRRSTELAATASNWDAADAIRRQKEQELVDEVVHGINPSVSIGVACREYLKRPRKRPLGRTDLRTIQDITRKFRAWRVREIDAQAWINFVETRQADNKAETRERYINTIVAFLHWCQRRPRKWLDELPEFERNKDARNPRQRARRRVAELSPELISFMIGHAASHLKPQLYIEWSTGWRVSSVLHGIRICDVILAEGRESVTTHFTKNGEPVTAALHPAAARAVATYLQDRGQIHDREAPLFLTQRGQPYSDKSSGAQNKTAFNAMRRRAAQALRERGRDADQADAALIERVTQHWFRHMLATNMLKGGADIGTVMRQGGWLDEKSVLGYDHDVPDFRRQKVTELPIADTSLTRDSIKKGGSR